jgi:hypothetical protein
MDWQFLECRLLGMVHYSDFNAAGSRRGMPFGTAHVL